jgi:hypothetical protein
MKPTRGTLMWQDEFIRVYMVRKNNVVGFDVWAYSPEHNEFYVVSKSNPLHASSVLVAFEELIGNDPQ